VQTRLLLVLMGAMHQLGCIGCGSVEPVGLLQQTITKAWPTMCCLMDPLRYGVHSRIPAITNKLVYSCSPAQTHPLVAIAAAACAPAFASVSAAWCGSCC
jgi:hypothetical protein